MIKPFILSVGSETIRKMPENKCVAIWLKERHRWLIDLDKGINEADADLIFHTLNPLSGSSWLCGGDWVDALNTAYSIRAKFGAKLTVEPVKVRENIEPFVLCEQGHAYKLVGAGLQYVEVAHNIRDALKYARLVKRLYDAELIPWQVARRALNSCPDYLTVQRRIDAARVAFWPVLSGLPL